MYKPYGITAMFPFWSAITAAILAQTLKPLLYWLVHHEWKWSLIKESGGFPSSHSALVTSLALAVGFREHFSSTIFAVTLAFAVIVIYDAANVRYYSGQNIKITQQLLKDLQSNLHIDLHDPIYQTKIKLVLGHKWIECFGGMILGVCVALFFHYCILK